MKFPRRNSSIPSDPRIDPEIDDCFVPKINHINTAEAISVASYFFKNSFRYYNGTVSGL